MGLETALRSHPLVTDCAVLARTRTDGSTGLVAYVVSSSQVSPGRFESHLDGLGYAGDRPAGYVPVASLPLTSAGGLDRGALARIPVLDDETVKGIEIALSESSSAEVVVIADTARDPRAGLHLADLLVPEDGRPSTVVRVTPTAPVILHESGTGESGTGPRAEVFGGPAPVTAVGTLPEMLDRAAATQPSLGITYIGSDGSEDFQSYPTLLAEATAVAHGLVGQGLPAGSLLLFQLEGQRDFLTAFWGCQLAGMVPVPAGVGSAYGPAAGGRARSP